MKEDTIVKHNWGTISKVRQEEIISHLRKNPHCLWKSDQIQAILDQVNPRVMMNIDRYSYWFHPEDIEKLTVRFKDNKMTRV